LTALSGVGAALSVGAGCAPLSELNIAAEASTKSAVNSVFVLPIPSSFRERQSMSRKRSCSIKRRL
jgi:hypothetical protein